MTSEVGAPFSSHSPVVSSTTASQLELRAALEIVAGHAMNNSAGALISGRTPSADQEFVAREISEVADALELLGEGVDVRVPRVPDIREALEQASLPGSVLDAEQIYDAGLCLAGIDELASSLKRLPETSALRARLGDTPDSSIAVRILESIEPGGTISDSASPELRRARKAVRDSRNKLVKSLETLLKQVASGDLPPDAAVTQRGGRYVVPIRRDARGRVKGLIHDESASGATLFVEPEELVGPGNELAQWQSREKHAEVAVLRELTDLIRNSIGSIEQSYAELLEIDSILARARYAASVRASAPAVSDSRQLTIRNGRHPVLLDSGIEVQPFDMDLDGGTVVLISGPNAGGKTVLLKTVGLICALHQCGVVPPTGAGTCLPVLSRIFSDIGDNQSITASLSTFSAHLSALREISEAVDSDSLVLLDELGTGTDPTEGAAIGTAVVELLSRRSCFAIASTHLGPLKELAAQRASIRNASMRFNEDELRPTFELVMDVPGRSYGVVMARRIGLPGEIVDRAEEVIPERERDLDQLLSDLEKKEQEVTALRTELEQERERQRTEREQLELWKTALEQRQEELASEKKRLEKEGREEARRFLLDARKEVERAIAAAKSATTPEEKKEARKIVEEKVREEGDALQELAQKFSSLGWKVKLGGKSVVGDAGGSAARRDPIADHSIVATAESEVDLRGLRADEAEMRVLQALDAAVAADLGELRIIHGKGTGVLRQVVQGITERDARVKSSQLAPVNQGGAGVTIARFG